MYYVKRITNLPLLVCKSTPWPLMLQGTTWWETKGMQGRSCTLIDAFMERSTDLLTKSRETVTGIPNFPAGSLEWHRIFTVWLHILGVCIKHKVTLHIALLSFIALFFFIFVVHINILPGWPQFAPCLGLRTLSRPTHIILHNQHHYWSTHCQ